MFNLIKVLINENSKVFYAGTIAGFVPTLGVLLNTHITLELNGILIEALRVAISLIGAFATGVVTVFATKMANKWLKKIHKDHTDEEHHD